MARAREPRHVRANLGGDHGRRGLTDARDCGQEADGRPKRDQRVPHARFDVGHGGVERPDRRQMQLQDEPMMGRHASVHRRDQLGARGFQTPRREISQACGIGLPRHEAREDRPPTRAQDVADHFRQLHIGVLEGLLDPRRVARDLAHQLRARAREVAQLLDGRRRHEAAPDQPQGQQVADPRRVVLVTLAPRDVPDMHRVGEHQLDVALPDVPDGLPVHAGRRHRDMGDGVSREPVGKFEEPASGRRDRPMFVRHRRARRETDTGDDRLGMHIQAGTARRQDLHQPPPLVRGTGVESPDVESRRCALRRHAGVAIRGARGTPGHTNERACRTNEQPTLVIRALEQAVSVREGWSPEFL